MCTAISKGVNFLQPKLECPGVRDAQTLCDTILMIAFEYLVVLGERTEVPCLNGYPERNRLAVSFVPFNAILLAAGN